MEKKKININAPFISGIDGTLGGLAPNKY